MTITSVNCDRISASEEALLAETADIEEQGSMELFFDAPYHEINHEEFKAGVKDGLKELGCSDENLKKVSVDLRPGSTVAEIRGPATIIGAVQACPLNHLSVLGYQAFQSLGDLELYQATEKAKALQAESILAAAADAGSSAAPEQSPSKTVQPAVAASAESSSSQSRGEELAATATASSSMVRGVLPEMTPVARIRPGMVRHSITERFLQEDTTQQLHFQEIRELQRQRDEVVVAAAIAKTPEEASELEEQLELLEASLQEAREEYVAKYEKSPQGENPQ